MSKIKLKYIADSSEGCKQLEEAVSYFSDYFRFDMLTENETIIVESTLSTIKNLEGQFVHTNSQGVKFYPEKESKIIRICKEDTRVKSYNLFHFGSSKEGLSIGIEPNSEKKYLFEVYYQNPNFKKE
jgi:hypothetical protein